MCRWLVVGASMRWPLLGHLSSFRRALSRSFQPGRPPSGVFPLLRGLLLILCFLLWLLHWDQAFFRTLCILGYSSPNHHLWPRVGDFVFSSRDLLPPYCANVLHEHELNCCRCHIQSDHVRPVLPCLLLIYQAGTWHTSTWCSCSFLLFGGNNR